MSNYSFLYLQEYYYSRAFIIEHNYRTCVHDITAIIINNYIIIQSLNHKRNTIIIILSNDTYLYRRGH